MKNAIPRIELDGRNLLTSETNTLERLEAVNELIKAVKDDMKMWGLMDKHYELATHAEWNIKDLEHDIRIKIERENLFI